MEFHVHKKMRDLYNFSETLFSIRGPVIFANLPAAREFTRRLQEKYPQLRYQDIFAMGLIDEILHYVISLYTAELKKNGKTFAECMLESCLQKVGQNKTRTSIKKFTNQFPPSPVYRGELDLEKYLEAEQDGVSSWAIELEEMLMLWVENRNPAYAICSDLFDDSNLDKTSAYTEIINCMYRECTNLPLFGPENQNIIDMIRSPALNHPHSLEMQLEYIKTNWGYLLGDILYRLLRGVDYLKEVNAFFLRQGPGGPGDGKDAYIPVYGSTAEEYERFTPDKDWMPRVVLLAKTTLVWLHQLSEKYHKPIIRLDQIPDEELDLIAERGFNALWLIGLWNRSEASRKIKNWCGNPDAAASAYALMGYDIAQEIGGWAALENLRLRAWNRGIRLASDMVPNHTGLDSYWVKEHPDWFVQLDSPPFPSYTFNSGNLSDDPGMSIHLEDHYYDRTDAAVVFKRVDTHSGEARYIYHGNDGTHMPWNDTAQLDFSKKEVREAIIQTILHVASNFPIIRFDAAMTLAKQHIQRLWFPLPGSGGAIPSRAEHGMSEKEFNEAIPQEFWREVVDRCASEAPDTLLLAEAFWMMEGYFVRTLGMHRVYNSAFMNMLKNEDNAKYQQTIKNTLAFDKDILKRFVNFMNNPDEETAVAQFGKDDKYFGVCTLMITMPGLPMIGHGQVEGYTEKYGMEFRKPNMNEVPDTYLLDRHYREIFPLMKKRYLFAEVDHFFLFDVQSFESYTLDNIFAYTNSFGNEYALILYNNSYQSAAGTIKNSAEYSIKTSNNKELRRSSLGEALGLSYHPEAFCLFFEQRSKLWYIRRSLDIHQKGLNVMLQGYQAQVYLDIHEVQDNSFAHYKQLEEKLAGKGVPDISAAIDELLLAPIHAAYFQTLYVYIEKISSEIAKKDSLNLEKAAEEFTQAFTSFIERLAPYVPNFGTLSLKTREFEGLSKKFFEFLQFFKSWKQNKKALPDGFEELDTLLSDKKSLLKLLCFISLYILQDENRSWQIQQKLEALGDFRYETQNLSLVLSGLSGWTKEETLKLSDLLDALAYMEVQEYLLINYYDGIRWYSKERMEHLMLSVLLWECVGMPGSSGAQEKSSNPDKARCEKLIKLLVDWKQVHEKAECKVDLFRKAIKERIPAKLMKKTKSSGLGSKPS